MRRVTHYLIILIIILAGFLRFWQLGNVPPSPDWDEAALGYNAYSILKTGRDEYGTFLPLILRSFDDYKPPLYAYLAIPSVAVFGLNTWAVRLPSAILGVLAVIGTYLLVGELFRKSSSLSLISSFLLTISPWHLQFSRIAFEANTGVTLNIWALVFFFKGMVRPAWFALSAFLFGLGFYAYHSERIFLPLLLLITGVIWRKKLVTQRKYLVIAAIVGVITIAPLIRVFFDPVTLTRLRGTSSLADQTALLARSVQKLEEDQKTGNPWGIILDNRRLVWARTIIDGYLSHYSLRWLFLTGDNPRHHTPDIGLLYLWELPFLFWGIYTIFVKGGPVSKFLFGWFLAAPVAASPTTELPHAIRSLVFLPTFQIFTAVGLVEFWRWLESRKNFLGALTSLILSFLIFVNIVSYFHLYFVHLNKETSKYWQYGYAQAVEYVRDKRNHYKKIVVSTKLEQPYMFFLYFLSYDPNKYLTEGGTSSGGFAELRNKFDIYEFRPINWEKEIKDGTTLYLGTPQEISGNVIKTIFYLDGTEAIRIAQ